jgi:repressor LexA
MTLPPLTRRQRDIFNFYQGYIAIHGISPTLEEVAQHFGLNKVTIFGHVSELERKGILRKAGRGVSRALQIIDAPMREPHRLPVLGTIAAGAPISALETPEVLAFEELAPPGKDVYALRVRGNSMIEDAICDGDLVLVERRESVHDGEMVVAVLPDEEATLKRFYREKDGRIRLQPSNRDFSPIFAPAADIRGVVIGVIRKL